MIDPEGDTDYYSLKGKKIGSDGIDNGLIGVVTWNKVARRIKKGKEALPPNPENGTTFKGGFVIHQDILKMSFLMATEVAKDDQEFSTTMNPNSSGGYDDTGIIAGPKVDLSKENQYATVQVGEGEVSIHSHPLGYDKTSFNTDPSRITPLQPMKNDEVMFQDHKMNIIVGMSERAGGIPGSGSTKVTQGNLEIRVFGRSVDDQKGRVRTRDVKKILDTVGS
jgi:hypothetical protein